MPPRLLIVGQAALPTGYARVLTALATQLADDFQVDYLGINHRGTRVDGRYALLPNEHRGDPWATRTLASRIVESRPSVILFCADIPVIGRYRKALAQPQAPPAVLYCAVHGDDISADVAREARGFSRVVAYTSRSRHILRRAWNDGAPCAVIPHGVDTDVFRPIAGGRTFARRQLFPDRTDLEDAFIVLNANRNTGRKRVDLTIRGFASALRDRPDAFLYLHMGMVDVGVDVLALAHSLGVRDRILTTTLGAGMPDVDDRRLNLIYNACDVGINTSTGEGWGLPAFEHAATGAAQIVPGHSACAELWDGRALIIPPAEWTTATVEGGRQGIVFPGEVGRALARLYQDADLRRELGKRAYEHSTRPELSWTEIATQWRSLLLDVATLA